MSLRTDRPAPPGMTIEYLGVPGAGKSTLAHRVAELLQAQDIAVHEATFTLDHRRSPLQRRMVKSLLAARLLLRHPGRAQSWARLIAQTRQRSWRELCHVVFNWCYLCELHESHHSRREILLLDEGIFQALWSIAYRAGTMDVVYRSALQPLSAVLPSVMVLVVVHAGPATISQRLRDRSESMSLLEQDRSRDGEYQLDHALACLFCIEDLARQYAGRQGGERSLTVLVVDNSSADALPVAVQQIVDLVRTLAAAPQPLNTKARSYSLVHKEVK